MTEHSEKLIQDIKLVLRDLEDIANDAKDTTSQELLGLQGRMTERINALKGNLIRAEQDFLMKEQVAVAMTSTYVHQHAWRFIIVAAVLGFLLGYYI